MTEEDLTPIASALSGRVYDLISEILAEQGGGICNSFVLLADFLGPDGEPGWVFTVAPDQRMLTTAGLVSFANAYNTSQIRGHIERDDDDG